jgi:hypothetical protein
MNGWVARFIREFTAEDLKGQGKPKAGQGEGKPSAF